MLRICYIVYYLCVRNKNKTLTQPTRAGRKSQQQKIMKNLFNTVDFEALNGNAVLGKNRLFKIDTREIEGQGYLLLEK